jgi:hypothetical protein
MLPKIDVPLYEITLPLSGKKLKIRPFLVKEEKILLMAMETDDDNAVMLAIKQIVTNCCVDDVDVDELPILDLEYIFLQLRARSVGEIIDLQYRCNNNVGVESDEEPKKCGHTIKLSFNALEVKPEVEENHTKKIQLTSKLGVVMKYPDFKLVGKISNLPESDMIAKTVSNCIDYIFDDDSIYYAKDATEEELVDFIDSLTREQFAKIQEFFDTVPKLKKHLNFKCSKCGYEEELVLEGIQSFFV